MPDPLYTEVLPGGAMWSMTIPRHRLLRLTALDDRANVSALFYRAAAPLDRLNVPDTLKALHTAKLTRGHILMSDMGHALVSIVDDTLGWHDALCGHINAAQVTKKFGGHDYQTYRNDWHRNAHDNFLVELAKHGLGLADLVANVNFFSKVTVDDDGRFSFVDHPTVDTSITLRTECEVLAVFANCPHPLMPGGEYPASRVQLDLFQADSPAADDYCRNHRPECARTLALTERLYL